MYGTARGGCVEITVDGVVVSVATLAGQTPEEVAAALAAAIEADPVLSGAGVTAFADGSRLVTTGGIDLVSISDAGLSTSPIVAVPALSPAALGALAILIGATAAAVRGRRSRR